MDMNQGTGETWQLFVELGSAIIGLAFAARVSNRWGFSAIPLYLMAGLAFGNGGITPLHLSQSFIHVGAEIGVLLLLFMLGLEYTGQDLARNLKTGLPAGITDLVLNFPPGLILGLALGWSVLPSLLLGGVTYISSSGIIAKVLGELGKLDSRETRTVLSVLVLEDLAMALYLPLIGALLVGGTPASMTLSVGLSMALVSAVLFIAIRYGHKISRMAAHESDEIILLTVLGAVLLVAGITQKFQVSAAIGAFLVGIAASGPLAEQSHRIFAPLRDLFAATFFFFFGLEIDPSSLPREILLATLLAAITAGTKILTGYLSTRNARLDRQQRIWVGAALVARGEFSIVIAGLGVSLEPQLGPLSATYVLVMAILGPLLARALKR
jgi:monovalent cation:H+ antiporter-2, CPA2 family